MFVELLEMKSNSCYGNFQGGPPGVPVISRTFATGKQILASPPAILGEVDGSEFLCFWNCDPQIATTFESEIFPWIPRISGSPSSTAGIQEKGALLILIRDNCN